jgi:hypothetical protein
VDNKRMEIRPFHRLPYIPKLRCTQEGLTLAYGQCPSSKNPSINALARRELSIILPDDRLASIEPRHQAQRAGQEAWIVRAVEHFQ